MEETREILEKANYCLKCKAKPCSKACPMHTNIPEFIEEISKKNYEKAYEILIENNIFTHICSIVCPQEEQCEGSCVRGIKQEPTQIGKLEKFINEWAEKNNIKYTFKIEKENDKKIAVIGSGPAGLQAAYDLRKKGFKVTVFEKEKTLGGILNYGIPDFRLKKEYVNNIIEELKKLGIEFEIEKELGKNLHIKELLKNYDSIFLGIGAETPSKYELGEFDKIYDSDYFLKSYNSNKYIKDLGNVVVIGGGNVAMDSARAAIKMGATTSNILYRRDEENMPARKIELQEAIEDGVKTEFKTRVIKAEGKEGKIEKVKCIKTEVIDGKAIDMPNTEFDFKADSVVFAIGLKPNKKILENEGIEYNEKGLIIVDDNGRTNIDNVYAGGDLTESKSTVCRALGSARKAANSIIKNFEKGE